MRMSECPYQNVKYSEYNACSQINQKIDPKPAHLFGTLCLIDGHLNDGNLGCCLRHFMLHFNVGERFHFFNKFCSGLRFTVKNGSAAAANK